MRYFYHIIAIFFLTTATTPISANDIDKLDSNPLYYSASMTDCHPFCQSANPNLRYTHQNVLKKQKISMKHNMLVPLSMTLMEETQMVQRAWLSSMVIPGLGQIYNKQFWKVPVIYSGLLLFGSIAYSQYREFKEYCQLWYSLEGPRNSANRVMVPDFLERKMSNAERGRNLWMIITSFWYLINIFDAYAGANMRTFGLSDDIGVILQSNITKNMENKLSSGLHVVLNFNTKQ